MNKNLRSSVFICGQFLREGIINRQTLLLPAALILFTGVLAIAGAIAVRAHAELLRQQPEAGAVLTEFPAEIRLTFNEPVGPGSAIFLFTNGFQYVDGVTAEIDAADPAQLAALLPPLAANEYTVQWTAVSQDGHTVSGSYTFRVAGESPPPSRLGVWLALTGVALGAALLAIFLRRK